jgi:type II secretory pathway pseudopilin PulG
MSDRKLAKAVQTLIRHVHKLSRTLTRALVNWLLRTALVIQHKPRHATAGFVLPTTVLLILVVGLSAGALTYRAFNTSTRSISETQNRAIFNAASPAVDRARAKLEFLFDASKDTRFPGGVPSEEILTSMLLNDNSSIKGKRVSQLRFNSQDPYTLPGETRISINDDNGDGTITTGDLPDNAWSYEADTNGDGQNDATVVYSVVFSTPPDTPASGNTAAVRGFQRVVGLTDLEKATGRLNGTGALIEGGASTGPGGAQRAMSYARTGPLSARESAACATTSANRGTSVEAGWIEDANSTAILRKNFQVDALVIPFSARTPGAARNFSTLEFQQDRRLDRGNKWGAWFRNDLEVFPGVSGFQWNGAMHTEGSLLIGGSTFSAYLISSPESCFWYESASEITVTNVDETGTTGDIMEGQVVSGRIRDNSTAGSASRIYIWASNFNPATNVQQLDPTTDSIASGSPADVSIDPVRIQTRNGYRSRGGNGQNREYSDGGYPTRTVANRIKKNRETAPYVDDTYRADDRYGPKLIYDRNTRVPTTRTVGQPIQPGDNVAQDTTRTIRAEDALLTTQPPVGADSSQVGLDGYWERRARIQGLRLLVGQRLELGNPNGWVAPQDRPRNQQQLDQAVEPGDGDLVDLRRSNYSDVNATTADAPNADPFLSDNEGDPLYPPHSLNPLNGTRSHEARQRRALRDNLSAVQAAAVYHAAVSRDYPIACIASTAHPGSPFSLRQSVNFVPTKFREAGTGTNTALLTDFLNGRGTNGWEFSPPSGSEAQFAADVANSGSPLRIALENLANFAGDHINENRTGAFPPSQIAGEIHPDPEMTMWGNFSNLRRTLAQLNAGTSYGNLSPADKTYLQTAACTLGMLAYNIDRVQRFDPSNLDNDSSGLMYQLAIELRRLMNGVINEAAGDFEVLPKQRLATYNYNVNTTTPIAANYNPRDYDLVPPEAFLAKLREVYLSDTGVPDPLNNEELRLAELIVSHFQVRRDRTYGFRASPAANTWNYNPYITYGMGDDSSNKLQLWSSACDPNVFTFQDTPPLRVSGRAGAEQTFSPSSNFTPDNTWVRLAVSRLCGAVIPPVAIRDYPGDTSFPPRKMQASLTAYTSNPNSRLLMEHIPRTTTGGGGGGGGGGQAPASGIPPSDSTNNGFAINPGGGGSRASDLYFGDPVSIGGGQQILRQDSFMRASVAPKWPALYYLFPQFNHDHDGDILEGTLTNSDSDDVDHRQPNGSLTERGSGSLMLAGFQPWAEPYITDSYIQTANSGVTYRVVDPIAPISTLPTTEPTSTGDTILGYQVDATFNNTFTSASSESVTFRYRTYSFPVADRPVGAVALRPRSLPASVSANPVALNDNPEWQLPVFRENYSGSAQNVPVNRIMAPNGDRTRGRTVVIPFLDRVLFNGREWMPVRVMDMDIGMLRRTQPRNQVSGNTDDAPNDSWLPASGIVYAFREDAVREDAINRPGTAPAICEGGVNSTNLPCTDVRNAANPASQVDPPLADQGVSVKAVDFVPDPDRRPHGFRLRNGSQLTRLNNLSDTRGLSFFTDNPAYIMGHYNLHQTGANDSGTPPNDLSRTEEFTQRLPDNAPYTEAQFYTDRRTEDPNFAEAGVDRWRPSEILADAVTILSNTFCDGSALDTFMTAGAGGNAAISTTTISGDDVTESNTTLRDNLIYPYRQMPGDSGGANVYNNTNENAGSALYGSGQGASGLVGCQNNGRTSFLNQNRPNTALPTRTLGSGGSAVTLSWEWQRENPYDRFSPVKISRNGDGLIVSPTSSGRSGTEAQKPMVPIGYNLGYYNISQGDVRPLQPAENTRINSIIVSGIPPSRNGQSYGGLHNFPRMLEDWRVATFPAPPERNLWLAGSFLQLSFSNYATGPFDAKAWEPAASLTGGEQNRHYDAPNRLWGYDVALQKMPAGPAAARFVTPGRDRSEFYNEPAANDPYIRNLCLAAPDTAIPDANCPS